MTRALTPGLLQDDARRDRDCRSLLALVLFVVLPRLRSSVVRGSSFAPVLATAGFSDHVALGELGRIRQDPTRGDARRDARGRAARPRAAPTGAASPSTTSTAAPGRSRPRRAIRWPAAPRAASASAATRTSSNLVQTHRARARRGRRALRHRRRARAAGNRAAPRDATSSGGLYAAGQANERVRYTRRDPAQRVGATRCCAATSPCAPRRGRRALPASFPSSPGGRSSSPARSRATPQTDADRVRAIEQLPAPQRALQRHARRASTHRRAARPSRPSCFGELAGHCEYFASAMVVLARTLGISGAPRERLRRRRARTASAASSRSRRSDAHAWVEVHFAARGLGALRPDASRPARRAPAPASRSRRADARARQRARALVVPARRGLRPLRSDPRPEACLARLARRSRGAGRARCRQHDAASRAALGPTSARPCGRCFPGSPSPASLAPASPGDAGAAAARPSRPPPTRARCDCSRAAVSAATAPTTARDFAARVGAEQSRRRGRRLRHADRGLPRRALRRPRTGHRRRGCSTRCARACGGVARAEQAQPGALAGEDLPAVAGRGHGLARASSSRPR